MGMISDFFDLNSSTPEILLEHEDPWSEFSNLQCKGIDPVKLSKLLEIVGHGNYKDNLNMISPINPESEEGPWVFPIRGRTNSRVTRGHLGSLKRQA